MIEAALRTGFVSALVVCTLVGAPTGLSAQEDVILQAEAVITGAESPPPEEAPQEPQVFLGGAPIVIDNGYPIQSSGVADFDEQAANSLFLFEQQNNGAVVVDEEAFCWKETFGRVSLPTECGEKEYDAGFCYPKCDARANYHGHATICYEDCPEGYTDDLATCRRDVHTIAKLSYARGVGEPRVCAPGQIYDTGLCYDPCPAGFEGTASTCWKADCPDGYANDPFTCRRDPVITSQASYTRGAGQPLVCRSDLEYDAGLCYPKCGEGWRGAATICYADCPEGFSDDGLYCGKPGSYTRGGWALWDKGKCDAQHAAVGGCEQWGAFYYQKCKEGFHNAACCVCSPSCPEGWEDIGVSCKKPSRGRGVGVAIDSCPAGFERNGALCYPNCKAGFTGDGPGCWEDCPAGYNDDGVTCHKPAHIVSKESRGRGAGVPVSTCPAGLEDQDGLCYTPCAEGYYGNGPVCWREDSGQALAEECPEGYRDDGLLCTRDTHIFIPESYGRGVGELPECPEGEENSGGVCYSSCGEGYETVGPVCWQKCPASVPVQAGAACAGSESASTTAIAEMIFAGWEILMNAVTAGGGGAVMRADDVSADTVKTVTKIVDKADDVVKKVDDVVKKADELRRKVDDLARKADDLAKKADDAARKGDELAEKAFREGRKEALEEWAAKSDELTAEAAEKIGVRRDPTDELAERVRDLEDAGRERLEAEKARLAKLGQCSPLNLKGCEGVPAKNITRADQLENHLQSWSIVGGSFLATQEFETGTELIAEAVDAGEITLEVLSFLDFTGLYAFAETFIRPICEPWRAGEYSMQSLGVAEPPRYVSAGVNPIVRSAKVNVDGQQPGAPPQGGSGRAEVADTTAPRIVPVGDPSAECTSAEGTAVQLAAPKVIEASGSAGVGVVAPDLYPLGETTVTFKAVDAAGNEGTATSVVTVVDTTPPWIVAEAAEVTAECGSSKGTAVELVVSAKDACDPDVRLTSDAPELFAPGETTVTWKAVDASGNERVGTQIVRVAADTAAPEVECSPDLTLAPDGPDGAVAEFSVMAKDACAPQVTVACSSESGSRFALGSETAVRCTATDPAGNEASCSFAVKVLSTTEMALTLRDHVRGLLDNEVITQAQFDSIGRNLGQALNSLGVGRGQSQSGTRRTLAPADPAAACGQLNGFVAGTDRWLESGQMPAAYGEDLQGTMRQLIAALNC